jgi:sugar phosphate isomerase/epimerase
MRDSPVSRRTFLRAAAVAPLLAAAAAAEEPKKGAKIKVGCLSWCFHAFAPGADPAEAIDVIGGLGFDGVELILLARDDVKGLWTDEKIGKLNKQLEKHKLRVSQFVIFQPVVEGLSSVKADVREENLDWFEAGCKIGKKLGAPTVNIVAPWPRELKGPGSYLPRYYDIEKPKPGEKFHIDVAEDFDWDKVWAAYVEATKACLKRAKAQGMKLSIEHHTHTIIPDAVSFLRLWEAVRDPDLGYNLDTGWTLSQREYPPVAVHKVKKHLMNVHARDIDGLMRQFIHFGEGVMDFKAVVDALKKVGYEGYVSIEQDKYPGDMKATCARFLKAMRELIG